MLIRTARRLLVGGLSLGALYLLAIVTYVLVDWVGVRFHSVWFINRFHTSFIDGFHQIDLGAMLAGTFAGWLSYCWIAWSRRHDGCITHEGEGRVREDGVFSCRICD